MTFNKMHTQSMTVVQILTNLDYHDHPQIWIDKGATTALDIQYDNTNLFFFL